MRDVAAHLLDSAQRRLAVQRDGHTLPPPTSPIHAARDLVAYLNELNAEWVQVARRLSPRQLVDLLARVEEELYELLAGLDPAAPAIFAVAWAGEEVSPNWFDAARELTERWHHQQQIRDAVGAPPLYRRHLLHPVLDTFVRGLPYALRGADAAAGEAVGVRITGEAGGEWTLRREGEGWRLYHGSPLSALTTVTLDPDVAWRLFTKGLSPAAARPRVAIMGRAELGVRLLAAVCVMA